MDDSVQPLFPVPSCAVFGRRRATSKPMPETVRAYSGALPMRDAPEALVDHLIAEGKFAVAEKRRSRRRPVFRAARPIARRFDRAPLCASDACVWSSARRLGRLGLIAAAPPV